MSNDYFHEFDTRAIAKALLQAAGVTSGLWRLASKYRLGMVTGTFADDDKGQTRLPSVIAGLEKLAMLPADKAGPLVFDASELLGSSDASPKQLSMHRARGNKAPPVKKTAAKRSAAKRSAAKKVVG